MRARPWRLEQTQQPPDLTGALWLPTHQETLRGLVSLWPYFISWVAGACRVFLSNPLHVPGGSPTTVLETLMTAPGFGMAEELYTMGQPPERATVAVIASMHSPPPSAHTPLVDVPPGEVSVTRPE